MLVLEEINFLFWEFISLLQSFILKIASEGRVGLYLKLLFWSCLLCLIESLTLKRPVSCRGQTEPPGWEAAQCARSQPGRLPPLFGTIMDLDPVVLLPAVLFTVVAVYLASSLLRRKPDRPSSSSAGTNKPKVGYGDDVPPSRPPGEPLLSTGPEPEPAEKKRAFPELKVKVRSCDRSLMYLLIWLKHCGIYKNVQTSKSFNLQLIIIFSETAEVPVINLQLLIIHKNFRRL